MKVLDCTLRDGGYYTNWDFDGELVQKYFSSFEKLPVDYLEIGYRSLPEKEYRGRFYYLPNFVIDEITQLSKNKLLAIMLNEKSVQPKNLDKILDGLAPVISLIRLAVDPKNFDSALLLGEAIRKRGFDVAFNLMYMSKYANDESFLGKLSSLNGLASYVNMVDSYGGMVPEQVKILIHNVKSYCREAIGFHPHNNMELAFANSLAAIDAGCEIVDTTVMGMGRGAGNLRTELLLTYMASKNKLELDFNVLASLIEAWMPLYRKYEWGTNLPYMFSGGNSLPQKDVMEWVSQRFYSYNCIIQALHNQKSGEADNIRLPVFNPNKSFDNVIVVGGGPSAILHADAIKRFIDKLGNVCVIHASSKNAKKYDDVEVPQYFCLVGNEGHRLEVTFQQLEHFYGQCILPPYPRKMGTYIPERIKNSCYELEDILFTNKYKDAHTALALQTALNLSAKQVFLVGYDGYTNEAMTMREQGLVNENEYLFSSFQKTKIDLVSLLQTNYSIRINSVYEMI
ncbi:pyruvate carboxyltransferase [Chloroherpeton thalassium ATCC 35110]|uniref:Pyruvate carboxyltransferase n=1 Tax=Chloroherpeton thalassium (strain ATCC 35110 / GB-78) TaxID=517418 RepID=B3QVI9_CHLT3|nr:aldolase catalytic domain-containing protein [Chloroherpeton thalassium]ACF14589.1 pyruvate carboxyltransferase [Chloroherpeton thalassium ATCC 35110]